MKSAPKEDRRLSRVTEICLGFPESVRTITGDHAAYSVSDRKFAYYLDNHHGDGNLAVCFRAVPGQNDVLLAADPARFFSPAYIGPRGWIGLRLDVGAINWGEVVDFLSESYRLAAPKRLRAQLDR